MTSWDVYWILMLDNIRGATALLCVTIGLATAVLTVFSVAMTVLELSGECPARAARFLRRATYSALPLTAIVIVAATLIPTTKQAAVICVLPKLVTEQNIAAVQTEAGELYGLAKQWLEENVEARDEEAPEAESH